MTTNRRKFITGAAAASTAAGALGFPMIAKAQSPITWKMTSAYPKGAPFYMDGPGSAKNSYSFTRPFSRAQANHPITKALSLLPSGSRK